MTTITPQRSKNIQMWIMFSSHVTLFIRQLQLDSFSAMVMRRLNTTLLLAWIPHHLVAIGQQYVRLNGISMRIDD
jgi:hypothetical protein